MPTTARSTTLPSRMGPRPVLELPLPKMTSVIGRTLAVCPSLACGYSRASADPTVAILACACARLTPALSRPTPWNTALLRSLNAPCIWLGSNRSAMAAGIHRSGPKMAFTPMNPGGATPITVNTRLLSRNVLPAMSLAAPNCACQVA